MLDSLRYSSESTKHTSASITAKQVIVEKQIYFTNGFVSIVSGNISQVLTGKENARFVQK